MRKKTNAYVFVLASILIFLLLVYIPVWTTPGNDFFFQLSLLKPSVIFLMVVLSCGNGLLVAFQWYVYKEGRKNIKWRRSHTENVSVFGSISASILATFGCAACYSALFSIFGLGTVSFFVEYRWWIASVAIGITLWAIYQATKKINSACEACST